MRGSMICPTCRRAYTEPELSFCVEDGTRLVDGRGAAPAPAPKAMTERPPPFAPVPPPAIRETQVRNTREQGAVVEGRYVIRGFLGEGGMARVYLAEDTRTKEQVALKILRREQSGNRHSRERFLREV